MKNEDKILIVHHGVHKDGVYIKGRIRRAHKQNNKLTNPSKYIPFRFSFGLV